MKTLTIVGGKDKQGQDENIGEFCLHRGEIYTIVGNTGSGKSRLIKDIEQLVYSDSVTKRRIKLDGTYVDKKQRHNISNSLIAHLSQHMRFVLDTTVKEFLVLHCNCRNKTVNLNDVVELANDITSEPISFGDNLNLLSGGQTRALMIADIACICDSPIVLIDEIENAGIDKVKAINILNKKDKLVLIVTHDVHTALMATQRIVMNNGAIKAVVEKSEEEHILFNRLGESYIKQLEYQRIIRKGENIR